MAGPGSWAGRRESDAGRPPRPVGPDRVRPHRRSGRPDGKRVGYPGRAGPGPPYPRIGAACCAVNRARGAFILSRLIPYNANIGKRLIKSLKLYFHDVARAAYLCGIEEERHLRMRSWKSLSDSDRAIHEANGLWYGSFRISRRLAVGGWRLAVGGNWKWRFEKVPLLV